MKSVIITAPAHPYLADQLSSRGFQILVREDISHQQLEEIIGDVVGLVITTRLKIDKALLDKAHNLQWIGRLGSGLELIDIDYALSKNIACISTPEGNCTAVGEHTLGLLLSVANNLHTSANEVANGEWRRNENRGTEITGKTIGIIGFGHTGGAFAKVLAGFDVVILAYDKYKTGFGSAKVREASFEQICRLADVISFHVPLTPETTHMANAAFFEALERKPIILNTSRGKVMDFDALQQALKNEKIGACALDVLENEKLSTLTKEQKEMLDFLTTQKNVLVTPHIAGYSHEAFYKMSYFLIEKLDLLGLI